MKSYAEKFERVNCKQPWTGKWLTWHIQRILHAETESTHAGRRRTALRFKLLQPICPTCLFNDFGFCTIRLGLHFTLFLFWEMWQKRMFSSFFFALHTGEYVITPLTHKNRLTWFLFVHSAQYYAKFVIHIIRLTLYLLHTDGDEYIMARSISVRQYGIVHIISNVSPSGIQFFHSFHWCSGQCDQHATCKFLRLRQKLLRLPM